MSKSQTAKELVELYDGLVRDLAKDKFPGSTIAPGLFDFIHYLRNKETEGLKRQAEGVEKVKGIYRCSCGHFTTHSPHQFINHFEREHKLEDLLPTPPQSEDLEKKIGDILDMYYSPNKWTDRATAQLLDLMKGRQ